MTRAAVGTEPRTRAARALAALVVFALAAAGCDGGGSAGGAATPIPPLAEPRRLAGDADSLGYTAEPNARAAGLDLDGDGRDELVIASARELAVLRIEADGGASLVWRADALGGAGVVATGDLDGDGRDDLAVGWGVHRDHQAAPARLAVYRSAGAPPGGLLAEIVAEPATSRAQFGSLEISSVSGDGPELVFSHFASKYEVRGAAAHWNAGDGRWSERELYRIRMGTPLATGRLRPGDEGASLLVGRSYGDALKSDGDVFLLESDGAREPLPHFRGVRSLRVLPELGSEPGRALVCYGDGWHWRYKAEGQGRVTCASRRDDGRFEGGEIARLPEYSIGALAPADLSGDGRNELLALGVDALWALAPSADGTGPWTARRVGPGGYDFAVLDVDGDGADEVAVAGESPAVLAID